MIRCNRYKPVKWPSLQGSGGNICRFFARITPGMEKEPQPQPDEITLVIRGIAYSLQQDILPRSEAVKKLKSWYPEADIQPKLSDLDYNE